MRCIGSSYSVRSTIRIGHYVATFCFLRAEGINCDIQISEPPDPQSQNALRIQLSIRVLCFYLVAGCVGFCQNSPSTDLLQGLQLDSSNSPAMQRPEMHAWESLPDGPSPIQPPAQAERFHTFGYDSAGVLPGFCLSKCGNGYLPRKALDFQSPLDKERSSETERGYVTPGLRHALSASDSFIGPASSAASGLATPSNFVVPDGAGKGKPNNSDFLGVLTSVATRAAFGVGRKPLLRLSKNLVRPPATRGPTSPTRSGLTFGKK